MRVSGFAGDVAGAIRPPALDFRVLQPCSVSADCASRFASFHKSFPFISCPKIGVRLESCRKNFTVRASGTSGKSQSPVAPLQFESPAGQLLSQIMRTHPHLLSAAIDQELDRLQADREAQLDEKPPASKDLLLYRRIAELKEKDRQMTLEEVIYCLIVQKFQDKNISMIPKIYPSSDPDIPLDSWPNQENALQSIHSSDALELIHSHLSLVLGERAVGPLSSITQISKVKLGKLYAASIMYGYFLRRVDQRFQLERKMKSFPQSADENLIDLGGLQPNPFWDMESLVQISVDDEGLETTSGVSEDEKSYRLRSYVMHLDAETLQRYATMRSKEAISLIEKQTQALFGRPDIKLADDGSIDISNDEVVGITFPGLTMLVLEAVAFGSFLWDSESYVETKYQFLAG